MVSNDADRHALLVVPERCLEATRGSALGPHAPPQRPREGFVVDHTDIVEAPPAADIVQPLAPQAPEEAGVASLEKIREILFGVQMRDVDRRFAKLEERLVKETGDLRDDLRKRLAALEQYIKSEVESLSSRLRAEHERRTDVAAEISRHVDSVASTFTRKTASLDEHLERAQRELRQQLLDQHQRLSDDLDRRAKDVMAALARESQGLRKDKADRAGLAALLTEMAMRLNSEFAFPPDGSRHE